MLPIIETERLILKAYTLEDSVAVQRLASDFDIYKSTLHIPHPYDLNTAIQWIETHEKSNGLITLGAFLKETGELIGAFSLGHDEKKKMGEVGYWVGKTYWNKGYASEGAKALMDYGFVQLKLNRVYGRYLEVNPASAKVMEKIGMKHEGILEEVVVKDGTYHNVGYLAMLRAEWLRNSPKGQVELKLRRATIQDASALYYIQKKAFQEDIERYGDRADCPANEPLERLKEKILAFDYYALEENNRIVAGAVVRQMDDKIRLSRIYIEPGYHNLGIGKYLMLQLETLYPNQKTWYLDTPHKNFRNHHFYESLGYVKIKEVALDETLCLWEYEKQVR